MADEKERIILAIDVGSSSIRCSAYKILPPPPPLDHNHHHHHHHSPPTVEVLKEYSSSRKYRSVRPDHTGQIELEQFSSSSSSSSSLFLLDEIDKCVDKTIEKIRHVNNNKNNNFNIIAVGFSTFVMNLIGLNSNGSIVGSHATMSYACNDPLVAQECQKLQRELGPEKIKELYQRTGTPPIHSAYALPQLRTYYQKNKNNINNVNNNNDSVCLWTTLTSLILSRWTGKSPFTIPISYSEASWTGLLNYHTCTWDEHIMTTLLLPLLCRHQENEKTNILPKILVDYHGQTMNNENKEKKDLFSGLYGIEQYIMIHDNTNNTKKGDMIQRKRNPYWDRWPELRFYSNNHQSSSSSSFVVGGGGGSGCRLFFGIGDGACANAGSKCMPFFYNSLSNTSSSSSSSSSSLSRIAVTIGTSAAARIVFFSKASSSSSKNNNNQEEEENETEKEKRLIIPEGLFCHRIDSNRLLLGGALTDGGSVIEWIRSLLRFSNDDDDNDNAFDDCMKEATTIYETAIMKKMKKNDDDDDDNNTTSISSSSASNNGFGGGFIPFLNGERSIGYRTGASACFFGLTRMTGPSDILLHCMEGVIIRLNAILQLLLSQQQQQKQQRPKDDDDDNNNDQTTTTTTTTTTKKDKKENSILHNCCITIVASGNALEQNSLWRQMLADCSGMNVILDSQSQEEGTSRGVAILIAQSFFFNSFHDKNETKQDYEYEYEEELVISSKIISRSNALQYWNEKCSIQEQWINAMSPLWENTNKKESTH